MINAKKNGPPVMPISKDKLKDRLSILEVSQKYSPKINERVRRPLIICPFHEDRNLGACRIYTDTNTFKCESCGAHGDMIKLASGYLDIPLSQMNDLLEQLVSEFGIPIDDVRLDYESNTKRIVPNPPDRLSAEEYTELLQSDHYSIPCDFHEEEFEEGEFDYVPGGYKKIFYRTLAVKDPEFHDWVICTVSRIYWLRYMHMAMFCQENGFELLQKVIEEQLERSKQLLLKGLIDKRLFRSELRLRNELVNEEIKSSA